MKKFRHLIVVLFCTMISISAVAGSGWIYSDDNINRYDPGTGQAQYLQSGTWVDDSEYESNPAYIKYINGSGGSSSYSGVCPYTEGQWSYNGVMARSQAIHETIRREQFKTHYIPPMDDGDYCCGDAEAECCACFYEPSDVPEWNRHFFGGISYLKSDYRVDAFGAHMDSDIYNLEGGATLWKDRVSVLTSARYTREDGNKQYSQLANDTFGFLVAPGYNVLSQKEQFINMMVYGSLDLSYSFRDNLDNQWRMMPGVGVSANRQTPIGIFATAYSFDYSRNMTGDEEVTGSHHIYQNNVSANYTLPITRQIYCGAGVLYSYIPSTPDDLKNDFTDVNLTLGAVQLQNWDLSLSAYFAVDSSDNLGINFSAGYMW